MLYKNGIRITMEYFFLNIHVVNEFNSCSRCMRTTFKTLLKHIQMNFFCVGYAFFFVSFILLRRKPNNFTPLKEKEETCASHI